MGYATGWTFQIYTGIYDQYDASLVLPQKQGSFNLVWQTKNQSLKECNAMTQRFNVPDTPVKTGEREYQQTM